MLLCLTMANLAFSQKNITLSGIIKNPAEDFVIVVNATSTKIVPDNKQDKIMLDSAGYFKITIPVTQKYDWLIVVNGNKRVDFFAEQGSYLYLTADGKAFDMTASFTGKGMEVPNYFANALKKSGGIMGYYQQLQMAAQRESVAFKPAIDSIKAQEWANFEAAFNQKGSNISKDFNKYYQLFLEYSVYDALENYPVTHQAVLRQSTNLPDIPVSLFEVMKQTPQKFDDKYLDIPFYQTYLQSFYFSKLSAAGFKNEMVQAVDPATGQSTSVSNYAQTDSVLKLTYANMPPQSAAFAAGRILAGEAKNMPLAKLETLVNEYKAKFPKSEYTTEVDGIVKELKKFDPGQPAIDFTFTTLEGKTMKLSDLKGKVVYMDFWASWCGPCKGEMPYAKIVKEHFKDNQDVVFLYVSIDDNEEKWKNGITALGVTGMNTRTPGWSGEITRLYGIQSIPNYFLIDKKGNFVMKKTPRPSQSDEVIKLIEGLL